MVVCFVGLWCVGEAAEAKFRTGFADPRIGFADPVTSSDLLADAATAGASTVRLDVSWRAVAPAVEPIDPTDPAAYNWGRLPDAVASANSRGLDVMLTAASAPDWAEGSGRSGDAPAGTWKPNAKKFGEFAQALASRFDGEVRLFEAWNEPNLFTFLNPQYDGKKLVGSDIYRRMLNAFHEGIHRVQPRAKVITGGTGPYGEPRGGRRTRPLVFLRDLLCLDGNLKPKQCKSEPKFDVLAHHPINTSGGPKVSALHPDDASTPDLKHVVKVLRKAEKRKRTATPGRHPVWVTEFWWETNPPDECTGVSPKRQAKWISRALRSFKRQGASLALNYLVRDEEYSRAQCGRASYQTGVSYADGDRKPSFRAFRRFGK